MIQLTSLFRLGVLVCLNIALSFNSPGIAWGAEAEGEAQHEVIPGGKAGEFPFMGDWEGNIIYHSPKFDDAGNLVAKARITVDLNGKRIHHEIELPYGAGAIKTRKEKPDTKVPGRITLQHHGDPIDFRNIWIVENPTDK